MTTRLDDLLRLYHSAECGADGYPLAWRRGDPRIPDLVRELAGHRCARCGHPYRTKQSSPEWSPCDDGCRHGGPVMLEGIDPPHGADEWLLTGEVVRAYMVDGVKVYARWRVLTVHHLTGEKADCRWWNLAPLCQRCHLTIQGKVKMHRPWPWPHTDWMRPYVAGFYAWKYEGVDLSRADTMARLDELLLLGEREEAVERMPV